MYTPYAVLSQLSQFLPIFAPNLFNSTANVTGTIQAGSTQTLQFTLPNHGLSNGNHVSLYNSLVNNPITAVTQFTDASGNSILTFTTANDHDLTAGYQGSVVLKGFTDPNLNGTFQLINVLSSTQFDITYNNLPTLTGSEVLVEYIENGLNGLWPVTVIDPNTLAITLTGAMPLPIGSVNQLVCAYGFRIWPVYDLKTGIELYTKQSANTGGMFIIFDDSHASKDPRVETEARMSYKATSQVQELMLNHFTLSCIFPTDNMISPSSVINTCYTTLLMAMYAVIGGFDFQQTNNSLVTMLINHGPAQYNKAFYIHNFDWEYNYYLTNDQLWLANNPKSRRLNQINFEMLQDSSGKYIDQGSYQTFS